MTTIGEAASELREDVPLNRQSSKSGGLCGSCSEDCLGGSKFINASFGTLTAVITIALVVQIYYGDYQVVPHGSVATDDLKCSEIGTSILKQGGNAIDAAIASTFCLCVVAPHLTSLDAEGQALIYNHRTRELPDFIDFGAVELASEGLPRLVLGMAYLHHLYSTISWKNLVQPSADLARNGFTPSNMFLKALSQIEESLFGDIKAEQKITLDNLADTLEKIADIAEDELYSHLTLENQPIHTDALEVKLNNYNVYIPGSPSIGPNLAMNLYQIGMLNFSAADVRAPEYVTSIANITQTVLRDRHIDTVFHNGTSTNVAAIDLADNYISLVMGMYQHFGARRMTYGYIPDVRPKTQQLCSRIPVIITDSKVVCGRRMVLGANDISTATQIITSLVIGKENVSESAEAPRFIMTDGFTIGIEGSHTPMFEDNVLDLLANLKLKPYQVTEPYYSSNIVEKFKDDLTSHSDSRGGGIASRF